MSADAPPPRRTGPFVQTVASAMWLAAIFGFVSRASSSSTRVGSATSRSSLRSFSWAYVRICSLTSTFRPLTWRRIGTANLPNRPREGDDVDAAGPGAAQGGRRGRDRGAARVHVVDEDERRRTRAGG